MSKNIPSYRLHKSSGQAMCRLDGKYYYFGKYGTPESRERYNRRIAEWLLRKGQPEAPKAAAGTTVDALLAAYWRFAEGYYRKAGQPTTQLGRIKSAFRPLRSLYGSTPAADFGPRELKVVREEMIRLDWSRKYINSSVGCIQRTWRWAAEEVLVPATLWHGLAAVRHLQRGRSAAREAKPIGPVDARTVARTLPHCTAPVADMVRLQLRAGMRPCEVCHMRAGDVDRSGRLPSGRVVPGVWVYVVSEAGNKLAHRGVFRVVFLGPKAQSVLAPYLERRSAPTDYAFDPREVVKATRATERYSTDSYDRAITTACKRAGVERWAPNQLRHARATDVRRSHDLAAAGALLGHSELRTTEIYAERDETLAADVARKTG